VNNFYEKALLKTENICGGMTPLWFQLTSFPAACLAPEIARISRLLMLAFRRARFMGNQARPD
jgi:hypothetical protein